ncbi:MAG: ribonuclease HII [Bacillota bacterium]|nr:ribonuclease HII [Bacillota bacterium]
MTRQQKDLERYEKMLVYEQKAQIEGFFVLAGIDEAGRGPLAGPVAAAACVLNPKHRILGLNDSKKLTPARRRQLYNEITASALSWHVALIDAPVIDEINIFQATCQAMRQAAAELTVQPDLLLIDAVRLDGVAVPVWPIIRGDAQSVSIAAASILAKVTRDQLMDEYDRIYPEYGFARHKGYGTKEHYAALLRIGPCPIHRMTYLRNLESHRESD